MLQGLKAMNAISKDTHLLRTRCQLHFLLCKGIESRASDDLHGLFLYVCVARQQLALGFRRSHEVVPCDTLAWLICIARCEALLWQPVNYTYRRDFLLITYLDHVKFSLRENPRDTTFVRSLCYVSHLDTIHIPCRSCIR